MRDELGAARDRIDAGSLAERPPSLLLALHGQYVAAAAALEDAASHLAIAGVLDPETLAGPWADAVADLDLDPEDEPS